MRRAIHTPRNRMPRPRNIVIGIAIAFAVEIAAAPALAALPSDAELARAQQAVAAVRNNMRALSVQGTENELAITSHMTNEAGRLIVRVSKTYQGHRVWGAAGIIHADPQTAPRMVAMSVTAAAVPAGMPTLSQDRAIAIALKTLGLKGRNAPPRAELVVFPTQYRGGVKLVWDAAKYNYSIDRQNSVLAVAPSDPFVWAYEVHLFARNHVDGIRDMIYVVDANTGAVLHAQTGLRNLSPPNPPTQVATDSAAVGSGFSQYSGTVRLDSTKHADGTFQLVDLTRGTLYNPYLHDGYTDNEGNPILDANGLPISAVGLQTLTETHAGSDFDWQSSNFWFDRNPGNVWGDGKQFVMFPYGGETSVNGQTAAVDAHFGMAVTWDFYKNVFHRDGIDNLGTSAISTVHIVNGLGYYYDNAFWSDYAFGMFYSDGTLNPGVDPFTGAATPVNPSGFRTLTEIDIIGHEMTHGVTANSAGLDYDGESGGMNEATSDIMGTMVEAYAKRPAGADSIIPLTGNDWVMGAQVSAVPLRSMQQPSSDGVSADNWYAGIKYLDVHFSSGPLNRMFYFLSQGSSASAKSPSYSAYLPKGMVGIGNDHAARIWYKALTEYLTPEAQYADARPAAISAATDLYGASSPEVAAVMNAFAAINVGSATGKPRVTIDLPLVHPIGTPLDTYGDSMFARMPIVAMTTTVTLQADVQNTPNKTVTWKLGGSPGAFNSPGFLRYGGVIGTGGQWSPDNDWGFHAMTVVSNADPLQYAEGVAWVVNGDADSDNEFDAIDLGSVALSWGLTSWAKSTHSIVMDGWVDSLDVTAIVEAFKNAFGGK